jgi:hypothetical protein
MRDREFIIAVGPALQFKLQLVHHMPFPVTRLVGINHLGILRGYIYP